MKTKEPDFTFNNGLEITARQFNNRGDSWWDLKLSRDELASVTKSGDNPRRDAVVAEAMANPRLIRGIGGTALEVAILNDCSDEVEFVGYGWGGNLRHPVAVNEAQALAANNPDKTLVFMNTFGAGKSDNLPKAVAKDLQRSGKYSKGFGEIVGSIYDEIADGRPVHLRGHSLGARTVIGAAPHMENAPETIIINDPTGTRRMGLLAIANSFAIKEGGHLGKYLEGGFDPHTAELQKNPGSSAVWDTKDGTKGGWKQQFLIDPAGLSKPAFLDDFLLAASHVNRLIRIISPELSELNKPEAISDIMSTCRDAGQSKALLEQYILHNHTHSVVTIPQVLATLYKEDAVRGIAA